MNRGVSLASVALQDGYACIVKSEGTWESGSFIGNTSLVVLDLSCMDIKQLPSCVLVYADACAHSD